MSQELAHRNIPKHLWSKLLLDLEYSVTEVDLHVITVSFLYFLLQLSVAYMYEYVIYFMVFKKTQNYFTVVY